MKKIVRKRCCVCRCKVVLEENEGHYCELCALEGFVEWLEIQNCKPDYNLYDGNGFRPEDRIELNLKIKNKKFELKELRKKYPKRVLTYKKKISKWTLWCG